MKFIMSRTVYRHLSGLIVIIGIAVLGYICPSVAHATESLHGDAVNSGVTDPRNRAAADNNEHAQIVPQRRPICERCPQNGSQKEGTSASNQQRQRKSSWKTDAKSRSMPAATSQGSNADNSRTSHDSVVLPKKHQQVEEESTVHTKQRKKLNRPHLQTAPTENSASSGKLLSLTTEEKLNRIVDAQRTKQGYNNVGKIQSESVTQVNLEASDQKGVKDHIVKKFSNKKKRPLQVLNKNMKDSFNKPSTAEVLSNQSIDAKFGHSEQLMGDKHTENNNLTRKQKNNVNVARIKKNKRGPSIIRKTLKLSSIGTVKLNNKSLQAKDQNKPSKVGHQRPSENTTGVENVGTTTGRVNVQKLRGSKNREPVKKNGFHRSQDVPMNDRYFADETKNAYVSEVERADNLKVSSRRRGDSAGNRLVRPSAADRLEQQISPNLSNSYRRLMDHIRKILHMFSESMEKLESYKAEIFNGTRYTIMMGTRDVIEELHKANDYIYDGMTSATQFTYETILKSHNNRHAAKTGQLQEAPINVTESAVDKRNFQPNLERAQREQNKAQADIGKVNAMQMKCLQGESRLKQVRDLFHTNYDRPILQDLYGYLNISIHLINRGLIMPAQLRELRRRKFYLDHIKDVITTANNLLINSTDAFQKAVKQTKENYDTFKNWLQKEPSKHHGFSRTSSHGLNAHQFGKLQQLVSQATKHVHELHRQYNTLHSKLESPLDAARPALTQAGKTAVQFDFKLLTTNLKLLLKDMLSSLDDLRIHIGSKIKLTWTKQCLSNIEGSGLIDTDDDEDLCEEEGSGMKNSDSEKVFATDNEDFTFIDEPVENTRPAKHLIQQFGVDLADFASKLVHNSSQIYDNALTFQGSLVGLQQQLNNIQSSISSVERSTDTQKKVILDFHDNARHVQEVKQTIPDISQKIAALRNLNLEDAVNKAKQAVEKSGHPSRVDQNPSQKTSANIKKIDKDRKAEISKMDDDFDYSGLFKQGQEIVSNYADITLLRSMTVESCGKIGNHFTYIKSNMSLLRQKVEKAREILTTLQLSMSKSGTGYISVPIPQTQPEVSASLTSSIKACVKPKTLEGQFLFVRGNNSASYGVSIDRENIAVTAYDKENNDLQIVTLDQLSITEEWYTLEIKRTGETLSVMAVAQGGKTQTKRAMIGGLDLLQPPPLAAYLGGMPENLGIVSGSWEGCVGNLMVNERALTLFNSDSKGVQPSLCTDHCISDKKRLSMVFTGNGFARFIPSANERITMIALNFKTRQKMASLFSLINRRQNFYLSVVMDNGTVKIESSIPGERILLLSLTNSLNDGNSHMLKVIYRGSRTYPELDGNKEAFSVERTAPQIFTELLDGVLIGARVLHSKQFLITSYRPLIGCIGDVFINDDRLILPDAVNVYNVFHGNCNSSDIWHSCWQWTDQSKPLSFGVVDNSNRISFLVSRDSFGTLIHFMKKNKFDIEVALTVSGIDVSSDDSKSVLIRPATDKSYFTLITLIDDGNGVSVKAWDQNVRFAYGYWGFLSADLETPHTVVIGESREGLDTTFTGSISQFTIEDRFYDLSQFSLSHNLTPCERPQEDIQPSPPPLVADEPFSCV